MQDSIWKISHLLPYMDEIVDTDRIHIHQCLASTNDTAKDMARNGCPHGTVVLANKQTAGRGRFNRLFYSPEDTGLYMTIVLDGDKLGLRENTLLTPIVAVLTSKVIYNSVHKKCGIKWVNDLYLEDKKVCGILTEGIINPEGKQRFVVGIGINIGTTTFLEEIQNIAGALFDKNEVQKNNLNDVRNQIAAGIINHFINGDCFEKVEEYMQEYREKQIIIGKNVTVIHINETYNAKVIDVDDEGCLIVERNDENNMSLKGKIERLISGEVSIKK